MTPRILRGLADGFIYHILNRGNGGKQVFNTTKDYETFIDLIHQSKKLYPVKIFAYCLMPDHFHMVARPEHSGNLSKWMHWLMTSHVRRYHRHYGTDGHIWQGRFKSFLIKEDEHLVMALRYVEGNPVRSGLVGSAKDWVWSSHRESIGQNARLYSDKTSLELPDAWDMHVDEPLAAGELERLRQSVNRQTPFGSPEWQRYVSKRFGLESTLRPPGRPRKGDMQ